MGYDIIEKYKCGSSVEHTTPEKIAEEVRKIKELDSNAYLALCDNARKAAEDFDIPNLADKYLKEIENSVEIYEAIVKTGNELFDTILTEKSLYCRARQIQVSCVADGSQMDFIDTIDLYALLGNAMDNAIEAVEQFKDLQKRQIDVMIYRQQHFLVIHVMNPLPGDLIYEAGLPVTTKTDKDYHGFGMRSMDRIVKKYEGFLRVTEEDGCFSLKMLIPIPTTKETTT